MEVQYDAEVVEEHLSKVDDDKLEMEEPTDTIGEAGELLLVNNNKHGLGGFRGAR